MKTRIRKLTEEMKLEIVQLYLNGITQKEIAIKFNVNQSSISDVVRARCDVGTLPLRN